MSGFRGDRMTAEQREQRKKERAQKKASDAQLKAQSAEPQEQPEEDGQESKVDARRHQRFARRDSAPSTEKKEEPKAKVIPASMTFAIYDYRELVGSTVEEAEAHDEYITVRIVQKDGRRLPGKKDLQRNRLNVAVKGDKIVELKSFG